LQGDFTHPSPTTGVAKVAAQLLAFFKTDPTSTPWFLKKTVVGQPPVCAPTADVTNGVTPLRVRFAANASDPDGPIRDYQWTFDDGTFATNANPEKVFATPGTCHARLTVTDGNGNTSRRSVTVTARAGGAVLTSPVYNGGRFRCQVTGPSNLSHVVEASTDLIGWVPLKTNRGPFTLTDLSAGNFPARFYRAVSSP
jgi:PKD repeat protein